VRIRVATGEASLSIPLPSVDDYSMTLRMDPFPRPIRGLPERLPVLDVVLNGKPIAAVPVQWNPERLGAYEVVLPRTGVRRGDNHLVLRIQPASRSAGSTISTDQPGLTDGGAIALWYVRVHPPAPTLQKK